jgi:hypothetical protein
MVMVEEAVVAAVAAAAEEAEAEATTQVGRSLRAQ